MPADGFFQKPERGLFIAVLREQKVNGLALLIDRTIEIPPLPLDFNIGFVHAPTLPHRTFAAMEGFLQLGAILDDPQVNGGVIHRHPPHHQLAHERFLERWDYRPAAKGDSWVIVYHPGPKFFADQQARKARQHLASQIAHGTPPLASPPRGPGEALPPLLTNILAVCGDRQNQAAYQKVLREYPEELIRMALAETRQAARDGRVRKTTGAY